MKWMGKNSFLGIAFGDRAITVAEIAPARGGNPTGGGARWEVRKTAEFIPPTPTPDVASQSDAATAATGAALGQFLRDNGFSHAKVVVGVPARWLVAREKEIPPSNEQQAADVLRMQAERSFSAELGELSFDYAGTPDTSAARGVLLMAMPKRQLDRVVSLVEAAGREVAAVMPSTLALADAVAVMSSGSDGLVLSVSGDAVELSAHRGGSPRLLRHLPVRGHDLGSQNGTRAAAVSSLAGEIRRTVAMMPRSVSTRSAESLHLWDGIGLNDLDASTLASQAGVDLRTGANGQSSDLASLGFSSGGAGDTASRFAPALALALAGAKRHAGAVDFLHPRLAPARQRKLGRRSAWAIALGATAAIALIALWLDVRGSEAEVAENKARLADMALDLQAAEQLSNRIGTARGWFAEGRPAVLECVRELTHAFPDGGEAIYVTKLTLPESRKGTLVGKSPNRDLVLDLADRLNKNRNFADVKLGPLDAGGSSNEVAFSISFTYQGAGSLTPAAAAARK